MVDQSPGHAIMQPCIVMTAQMQLLDFFYSPDQSGDTEDGFSMVTHIC